MTEKVNPAAIAGKGQYQNTTLCGLIPNMMLTLTSIEGSCVCPTGWWLSLWNICWCIYSFEKSLLIINYVPSFYVKENYKIERWSLTSQSSHSWGEERKLNVQENKIYLQVTKVLRRECDTYSAQFSLHFTFHCIPRHVTHSSAQKKFFLPLALDFQCFLSSVTCTLPLNQALAYRELQKLTRTIEGTENTNWKTK